MPKKNIDTIESIVKKLEADFILYEAGPRAPIDTVLFVGGAVLSPKVEGNSPGMDVRMLFKGNNSGLSFLLANVGRDNPEVGKVIMAVGQWLLANKLRKSANNTCTCTNCTTRRKLKDLIAKLRDRRNVTVNAEPVRHNYRAFSQCENFCSIPVAEATTHPETGNNNADDRESDTININVNVGDPDNSEQFSADGGLSGFAGLSSFPDLGSDDR